MTATLPVRSIALAAAVCGCAADLVAARGEGESKGLQELLDAVRLESAGAEVGLRSMVEEFGLPTFCVVGERPAQPEDVDAAEMLAAILRARGFDAVDESADGDARRTNADRAAASSSAEDDPLVLLDSVDADILVFVSYREHVIGREEAYGVPIELVHASVWLKVAGAEGHREFDEYSSTSVVRIAPSGDGMSSERLEAFDDAASHVVNAVALQWCALAAGEAPWVVPVEGSVETLVQFPGATRIESARTGWSLFSIPFERINRDSWAVIGGDAEVVRPGLIRVHGRGSEWDFWPACGLWALVAAAAAGAGAGAIAICRRWRGAPRLL